VVCATVIGAATACAVGAVAVQSYVRKCRRWGRAMEILQELEEKCATPTWKLKRIADAMNVEMHAGLASEGGSKLKMLITYVDKLPTGYCSILFFIQSTILFNLFIMLLVCSYASLPFLGMRKDYTMPWILEGLIFGCYVCNWEARKEVSFVKNLLRCQFLLI